ncbi:hypothetical protein C0J52_09275 [Blattella germanica]|nr:hypothetical protein C0J52_09275 [Blattella germanica]
MLRLRSENDRLKEVYAEVGVTRILGKDWDILDYKELPRSQSDRSDGTGTFLHTEAESLEIQARALQAELEEHIRLHSDQICTLMKDRDLIRREWNKERMAMQEEISKLSHRLKDTRDRLYDAMKELIAIKKDNGNEQFQWRLEKQKMLQKLEHIKDKLGENYPSGLGVPVSGSGQTFRGKTNSEICAKLDSLKDIIREKEGLILMYQERCDDLERETAKHRILLEKAQANYRDNTQKLSCHVAYLKRKYEDLDRRRKLEAEGFYNDVKILRKRLENIEKTIQKFLKEEKFLEILSSASGITAKQKSASIESKKLSHSVSPELKCLVSTAVDTSSKAVQLERELKQLMKRVEEIQNNLAS